MKSYKFIINTDDGISYLDVDMIKEAVKNENKLRCMMYDAVRLHASYDIELLNRKLAAKYPSEPDHIREYRLKNAKASTRKYYLKIFQLLNQLKLSTSIDGNQSTTKYLYNIEEVLHQKLTNFMYNDFLNMMLQDANALLVFVPEIWENKLEFELKLIDSHHILLLFEDAALIKIYDKYMLWTDKNFHVLIEENDKGDYEIVASVQNETGIFMAVKTGGVRIDGYWDESFLCGMLADLDSALIVDNDIAHVMKQYVYPEKWRLSFSQCKKCKGHGHVNITIAGRNEKISCDSCKGTGEAQGIFSEHVLDLEQIASSKLSGIDVKPPFVGYVEKSIEVPKLMHEEYNRLVRNALSAVNMEFLADSQLNQSGTAKEMDRSELRSFLRTIATHMQQKTLEVVKLILVTIIPADAINTVINSINVSFDDDFSYIIDNNDTFYESKEQSAIAGIEKKHRNNESVREFEKLIVIHDDLFGLTIDEKIKLMQAGVITDSDIKISQKLRTIISDLFSPSFLRISREDQKAKIIERFKETYGE